MTFYTFLAASYVCLYAIVLILVAVVFYLGRQLGLLYMRVGPAGARMMNSGPTIGDVALQRDVLDIYGGHRTIGGSRSLPQLVIFLSPGCVACQEIAPAVRTLARSERQIELTLISAGSHAANHAFIAQYRLEDLPYAIHETIALDYGVTVTPYALLLGSDGTILSKGLVNNMAHLESLVNVLDERSLNLEDLMSSPAQKDRS
jgi:methylamine dehydrogenase accessory protein MauD